MRLLIKGFEGISLSYIAHDDSFSEEAYGSLTALELNYGIRAKVRSIVRCAVRYGFSTIVSDPQKHNKERETVENNVH